jgi:hypothetical protein
VQDSVEKMLCERLNQDRVERGLQPLPLEGERRQDQVRHEAIRKLEEALEGVGPAPEKSRHFSRLDPRRQPIRRPKR